MKCKVYFKHMDHSDSATQDVEKKSKKLAKLFVNNPLSFIWSFHVKSGKFFAEAKCLGPSFEFHAEATGRDFYQTLELVHERLQKQMEKKHSKWVNKKDKVPADEVVSISLKRREKEFKEKNSRKKDWAA